MPDHDSTLELTELVRQAREEGDEEKLLALTKANQRASREARSATSFTQTRGRRWLISGLPLPFARYADLLRRMRLPP